MLAINAFFYAHIPMLLGVVCIAVGVGVKKALGGGVAMYLAGDVVFRRVLRIGRGTTRAVAAAAALVSVPLGGYSAMLQLVTLVLLLAAAPVAEAARPEHATRARVEPA